MASWNETHFPYDIREFSLIYTVYNIRAANGMPQYLFFEFLFEPPRNRSLDKSTMKIDLRKKYDSKILPPSQIIVADFEGLKI